MREREKGEERECDIFKLQMGHLTVILSSNDVVSHTVISFFKQNRYSKGY